MNRKTIAGIICLVMLTAAVYANSVTGAFLWDDICLIRDNAFIRAPVGIGPLFTRDMGAGYSTSYGYYRPLTLLSYLLDYRVWALNPTGFHLTNILLHILTVLGVYALTRLLYKDSLASFWISAVFAVHPVHSETVAYIACRGDILSALCMLAALICYVRRQRAQKSFYLMPALAFFAFALLAKENALIFPLVLLVYHFAFNKPVRVPSVLPFFLLAAAYLFLRSSSVHWPGESILSLAVWRRVPGFFAAVAGYVRLLFLPVGLHMEYGRVLFRFDNPRVLIGMLLAVSMIALAVRYRRSNPYLCWGLGWFCVALLPSSAIYPRATAFMAERWLYFPSVGFLTCIIGNAVTRPNRRMVRAGLSLVVVIFSCLTARQNTRWQDPIRLYQWTLSFSPDDARVHTNIGVAYAERGNYAAAVSHLRRAIRIHPRAEQAYKNLAVVFVLMGRPEEGASVLRRAIEADPQRSEGYRRSLELLYAQAERQKKASRQPVLAEDPVQE